MTKLVVLITSQIDKGYEIGKTWQDMGAPGVTLINSYGLHHLREVDEVEQTVDVLSILELVRHRHENNLIVLSVVDDTSLARNLIDTATAMIGDPYGANNGLMFTLDVEQVVGLHHPLSDNHVA